MSIADATPWATVATPHHVLCGGANGVRVQRLRIDLPGGTRQHLARLEEAVTGYLPPAEWSDWCGASSPAGGLICAALWGTYVAAAGSICIAWRGIPPNEAVQPPGPAGGRAGG